MPKFYVEGDISAISVVTEHVEHVIRVTNLISIVIQHYITKRYLVRAAS